MDRFMNSLTSLHLPMTCQLQVEPVGPCGRVPSGGTLPPLPHHAASWISWPRGCYVESRERCRGTPPNPRDGQYLHGCTKHLLGDEPL